MCLCLKGERRTGFKQKNSVYCSRSEDMCDFWLDNKNEWATLCVCVWVSVCVCVCVSTSAQQPPTKSLIQWHRLTQLSIKKLCAAVCWKSETWAGWGEFLALLVGSTADSTPWSLLIWAVAQSVLCGIQAFAENAQVWKAKLEPAVPKSANNTTQSPGATWAFSHRSWRNLLIPISVTVSHMIV